MATQTVMMERQDKPKSETLSRAKKSASAFRTISEVADELDVQQHVLRFWESKFTQVKPLKRGGGRRYYRPEDVEVLKKIHHLLYTQGYTIKGVQKLLKGQGKTQVARAELAETETVSPVATFAAIAPATPAPVAAAPAARTGLTDRQKTILSAMLGELKELRTMIKGEAV